MWLWWLGILCDGHPFTSDPGIILVTSPEKDRPTETALQSKANTHNTQGNCVARQQSMAGHCDLAIISFGSSHLWLIMYCCGSTLFWADAGPLAFGSLDLNGLHTPTVRAL